MKKMNQLVDRLEVEKTSEFKSWVVVAMGWAMAGLITLTAQSARAEADEFWSPLECSAGAAHLSIQKVDPLTAKITLQDPNGISDVWTAKGKYVGRGASGYKQIVAFDLEGQDAPLLVSYFSFPRADGSERKVTEATLGELTFACQDPHPSPLPHPPVIVKPCHARYCP